MPLPEYLTPILSVGGPAALAFVILRYAPDALLRSPAGSVAVLTWVTSAGNAVSRCFG